MVGENSYKCHRKKKTWNRINRPMIVEGGRKDHRCGSKGYVINVKTTLSLSPLRVFGPLCQK